MTMDNDDAYTWQMTAYKDLFTLHVPYTCSDQHRAELVGDY